MLIEKSNIERGDIVTIKCLNGDEVIGRLESSDVHQDFIQLKKPVVVVMAQQGFGLMPYILTADPDAKVDVDKRGIVAIVKTIQAMQDEYLKQTTNLVLAR